MLDEQTTVNNENVNQTSSVITDDVLKEIEKVANIEKQMSFLNARQGSVERAVSELQEKNKVEATSDVENTISEDTKEKETKKQKEDKNVLKKDDKLKAQLDSIEKKRYENIGVEFAKGAEKIFKELEKAKEIQEKMRTKGIDNLEKKDKDVQEKKKKSGFSFLKLGLAIAAVGTLLYLFRDTIDKFIPGFKSGAEKVFTPIKNGATKIFGTIIDSIVGIFHTVFDSIFDGKDGVKETMRLFFLGTLPDVMFKSGLAIISALGGKVDSNVASYEGQEEAALNMAMKFAESEQERRQKAAQEQAELHRNVLLDPLSSPGEIEAAQRRIGIDAMMAVGGDLYKRVADLYGVSEKQFVTHASYANNFMDFIKNHQDVLNSDYESGNIQMARLVYEQRTGKKALQEDGTHTGDFSTWLTDTWNKSMTAETWTQLQKANDDFGKRMTSISDLDNKTKQMNLYRRELANTPRVNGLRFDSKDSSQLVLKIKPEEISQNALAEECSVLFGDLKTMFSGESVNLPDLAKSSLSFINELIRELVQPLVNTLIDVEEFIIEIISSFSLPSNRNGGSNSSNGSGGKQSGVGGFISSLSQAVTPEDEPVILIDFDLNGNLLGIFNEMFTEYPKLVETMKSTNETLRKISQITVQKPNETAKPEDEQNSNEQLYNEQQFRLLGSRISNIEKYLEDQDGVDDDGKTKDFVLQATGS